ncbi:MAG: CoA transferase [Alphaproteobacteria bacterium]|nr:CoA transferase [Alphaproteobacteria bacterium]
MVESGRAPLAGIRVLDLTQVIAGPHCTTMLADLGAEVVKLERPGTGDSLRTTGRYEGREDHEDYFYANNRSKKSICLDLKDPDDRMVALALAEKADVMVENFAAGTADRLGVGWAQVSSRNDRIVYCSISGFGQQGPYRNRQALDPVIQAVSGVMSVTGHPEDEPIQIGAPLADVIAGMYAAFAIVSALRRAESEGSGCYIDISMQDAMVAALGPRMGENLQAGVLPNRHGNQNPMRVPADAYRTKDGRYLSVIVQNNRYWAPLCRALDRQEWLDDPRFTDMRKRVEHRDVLNAMCAAAFANRNAAEWIPLLEAEGVPCALVNNYAEAVSDPQVEFRKLIRSLDHPTSGKIRVVGPPWQMTCPQGEMAPPPVLGQHASHILREWLEWDPERISAFVAAREGAAGE